MRIFYAADSAPTPGLNSNLWRHNLYEPLVELGHDVVEFDYDLSETFRYLDTQNPRHRGFIKRNRPLVSAALLEQVRAAHRDRPVEGFFSYFYDACVTPETIDAIRALGITTVNWYCNGSYQLHLVRDLAPHYDWCLVPEKFRLPDYEAMGAHPIYCQEAANPNIYKPYPVPLEFNVTFVGQAYGERPAYIQYLLDQGLDVHVWGWGWRDHYGPNESQPGDTLERWRSMGAYAMTPGGRRAVARRLGFGRAATAGDLAERQRPVLPPERLGPPLADEDLIKMYSRSKINLGFSSCGDTHRTDQRILQVRLRDFEVPMSGGFYMVEYMEELEEFFAIGKEIVCYSGPEDLAAKIRYYLEHDGEREAIRQAGQERCRRDHTWHKRFQMAFAAMGLAAPARQL